MRWTPEMRERVTALWNGGARKKAIMAATGLSVGQFEGARMRFNLHSPPKPPMTLAANHPAVSEGRSLFPGQTGRLRLPVLKPGLHSPKLGARVVKGRWAGTPMFSLTLEERATCPVSCRHWRDCYGNRMHHAARQPHGAALVNALEGELAELQRRHPGGFVVRLHVLGDFYSVAYVRAWAGWLDRFPALRVFGYTAWQPGTAIGDAVGQIRNDRFWIRYSDGAPSTLRTGNDGIVCPAQTGATRACATCGLCWTTRRAIRFLSH